MDYKDIVLEAMRLKLNRDHFRLARYALNRLQLTWRNNRLVWRIPFADRSISGNPATVLSRITGWDATYINAVLAIADGIEPERQKLEDNLTKLTFRFSDKCTGVLYECKDSEGLYFYMVNAGYLNDIDHLLYEIYTQRLDSSASSVCKRIVLPVRDNLVYPIGSDTVGLVLIDGKVHSVHSNSFVHLYEFADGIKVNFKSSTERRIEPEHMRLLEQRLSKKGKAV